MGEKSSMQKKNSVVGINQWGRKKRTVKQPRKIPRITFKRSFYMLPRFIREMTKKQFVAEKKAVPVPERVFGIAKDALSSKLKYLTKLSKLSTMIMKKPIEVFNYFRKGKL